MTVQDRLARIRAGIISLNATAPELTSAEISELAQGLRADVGLVLAAVPLVATHVTLLETLRTLAGTIQTLEEQLIQVAMPLMEYVVPATLPLPVIAHLIYGDQERAAELWRLNQLSQAAQVEAGTVLRTRQS